MLKITNGRHEFYQWDIGQSLTLSLAEGESVSEVHIGNDKDEHFYVVEPKNNLVAVYDELLQSGKRVIAYEYVDNDQEGHTIRKNVFNVARRPKADEYEYTPTKSYSWEWWCERAKMYAESAEADANSIPAKMSEWWESHKDQFHGKDGDDGISPVATVTPNPNGATITVTDKDGTTTAVINNGRDGEDGEDGVSPTAKVEAVSNGAKITITDKSGTTTANVTNGSDYVITEADKHEIADEVEGKYTTELTRVSESLNQKADKTELALANRKINALTNILEGRELAFEKMDFESAVIDVPSGAVADSVLKIGGKSIVWNQLLNNAVPYRSLIGNILIEPIDGVYSRILTGAYDGISTYTNYMSIVAQHKIYISSEIYTPSARILNHGVSKPDSSGRIRTEIPLSTGWSKCDFIGNAPDTYSNGQYMVYASDATNLDEIKLKNVKVIDLTQMFGAGNEPTLEQCREIFTADYYPYNPGEIVSSQTDALEVYSANASYLSDAQHNWLENNRSLWEDNDCFVWYRTGFARLFVVTKSSTLNASNRYDNMIAVFENGTTSPTSNNSYQSRNETYKMIYGNGNLYDSSNARFVEMHINYSMQTIPTNLPVLRSAGTAHYEVEYNVTFKNMKSVDLGSLNWEVLDVNGARHFVSYNAVTASSQNAICSKYANVKYDQWVKMSNGDIMLHPTNFNHIQVYDDSYASASAFKSAMSGVILHYEAVEGGEDYTTNVLHERVGSVDLGTLSWIRQSSKQFRAVINDKALPISAETRTDGLLCPRFYPNESVIKGTEIDRSMSGNTGTNLLYIYDFEYNTAEDFKAGMQGIILYYELATERIKELPNLPSLEAINVESGGEIRFVDHSEMALPIPSTHEFIVRNSEV